MHTDEGFDPGIVRQYVFVILCELVTIAALWVFSRTFSNP
jgi:hypothetical protein